MYMIFSKLAFSAIIGIIIVLAATAIFKDEAPDWMKIGGALSFIISCVVLVVSIFGIIWTI